MGHTVKRQETVITRSDNSVIFLGFYSKFLPHMRYEFKAEAEIQCKMEKQDLVNERMRTHSCIHVDNPLTRDSCPERA